MAEIEIARIGRSRLTLRVEGTAPLICNRFDEKARQMMLDAQTGKARVREAKDPQDCFERSLYPFPLGGYGFPATAFKAAIVDAGRYFKASKITMTDLRRLILVEGTGSEQLVQIDGEPKMREDAVRNQTGVADLRFRGEFWPWSAVLNVVFVRGTLSTESLAALVDAAGIGGIGEWRPASKTSKTGSYGTFRLDDDFEMKEVTF